MIDTFGTEPAYNHEEYATLHGFRSGWGYWSLRPQQFMTMFREWPRPPLLLPGLASASVLSGEADSGLWRVHPSRGPAAYPELSEVPGDHPLCLQGLEGP